MLTRRISVRLLAVAIGAIAAHCAIGLGTASAQSGVQSISSGTNVVVTTGGSPCTTNCTLDMAPMSALSVKGNGTNATAAPTDISTTAGSNLPLRENGSGALAFGPLQGGAIASNTVPPDRLANANGNTVLGNATGTSAARTDLPMPSCSGSAGVLQWVTNSGFACSALSSLIDSVCSAAPTTCTQVFGYAYARWWGVVCDNVHDDGPNINAALVAINYAKLYLPAGQCKVATTVAYNSYSSAAGTLTVSGIQLVGQGRLSTQLNTTVSNGYAIAANPAWAAEHQAMFSLAAGTTGTLASDNYYVKTTINDPLGNEINVSNSKVISVTGPTGSIRLTFPQLPSGYTYNVYCGKNVNPPANYCNSSGTDLHALSLNGLVVTTAIGAAHTIPTTYNAVWQEASLSDLSINGYIGGAFTPGANGVLWFRVGYSNMTNVYLTHLAGNGLAIPNWTGDADGSFVITVDKSKFDTILGWGIMAAGNTLELSSVTVQNSAFNLNGTAPGNFLTPFTISSITNANPGVVTTASPHTLQFGDLILIRSVAGMSLPVGQYRACGTITTSSFALCSANQIVNTVDTTGLGSYTANSGNESLVFRPPQMAADGSGPTGSGAIAYTGLISNWINNGFTQNSLDFYASEAGSNDNLTFRGNDFENTSGVAVYLAAAINATLLNNECLSTTSFGATTVCVVAGTGLNKGGVTNLTIDGMKVRSDVTSAVGFASYFGSGGVISPQSISANHVVWQAFSGLSKYVGFKGSPWPLFWARFDGKSGGTCTMLDSYNVASCTRLGTGVYSLAFNNVSLDTGYSVSGSGFQTGTGPGVIAVTTSSNYTQATVAVTCLSLTTGINMDCDLANVQGFGNPY